MILESDVPNVVGFEPLVTRDIQHDGATLTSVEVIYRGDVSDTTRNVDSTQAMFIDSGWSLVSRQARGKTTVLNFAKDSRPTIRGLC